MGQVVNCFYVLFFINLLIKICPLSSLPYYCAGRLCFVTMAVPDMHCLSFLKWTGFDIRINTSKWYITLTYKSVWSYFSEVFCLIRKFKRYLLSAFTPIWTRMEQRIKLKYMPSRIAISLRFLWQLLSYKNHRTEVTV